MDKDVVVFDITIHRSELIPGGHGARIGYSDDFPGRQFLVIPLDAGKLPAPLPDAVR